MSKRLVSEPHEFVSGHRTILPDDPDVGAVAPDLIRQSVDRFVADASLGVGGVGEVVRAVDLDIGRRVAIKRLRHDRRDPANVARFIREIRLVGSLEHPNIVPLHDVGQQDEDIYAVMKWVDGENLFERIGRLHDQGDPDGQFGMDTRIRLFLDICRGIRHAHQHGILHRDIKPGNIMVGRHGEVQILDWGLAKRIGEPDEPVLPAGPLDDESSYTVAGGWFGTPAYMSPEQARKEPYTERSEVFALGVLFYELLTLRHPVPDEWPAEIVIDYAKTRRIPFPHAPVPAHMGRFIRIATHPDPDQRFASVQEMMEDLERRINGHVPVVCPSTLQRRLAGSVVHLSDRYPTLLSLLIVGVPVVLMAVGARLARWLG